MIPSQIKPHWLGPVVGEYNANILDCPECRKAVHTDANCVGFAVNNDNPYKTHNYGVVQLMECPHCFHKYYFHAYEQGYQEVLWAVEWGRNKHLVM
jgi:hypothetical protein